MKSTLNLKEQASLNSSNCYNYHNNNDNDSEGYNKKLFPCVHTSVCHILPILHPYQAFHVAWDILVIICLTFSCVQIPFLFAFDLPIDTNDGLGIFTLMIDIFLCIDICIQFRTAYYDEYDPLRLITCPILIAKRYLRFWFWFDLITSFPFDYILGGFHQGFAHYFKVLRLIRLIRVFRIIRVIRLLNHTGGKVRFSSSTLYKLSIFKIMFSMAFIAHLMACLWYLVGITMVETYNENSWVIVAGLNEENVTLFEKYSTSFYWAIITRMLFMLFDIIFIVNIICIYMIDYIHSIYHWLRRHYST